jgi:hypothetical protein
MAKAQHAPQNVTSTPVVEITGGGAAAKEILAGKTERWNDTEGDALPQLSGTPEVVEMDAGLGEQSKAEQIMMALRGDGTTEEYTLAPTKTEKVGDENTPVPTGDPPKPDEAPKPNRKDLLANIGAEKRARALEVKLAELQAQNKALTDGSIADAMRARGLTREQAMERLVLEGTQPAAVDPNPEMTAMRAEVARLKQIADRAEAADVAKIVTDHIADVDAPRLKSMKRIALPTDDGTAAVYKPTHELLAELAEQLWVEDGSPPATYLERRAYLAPAAQKLEAALVEEYGPYVAPAKPGINDQAAPSKPPFKQVPAVGKRGGPPRQSTSSDPYSGMDEYTRRLAIKREFGV